MCFKLRNTARRGRSPVPWTLLRMRSCTRTRTSFLDDFAILLRSCGSSAGLAGLLAEHFARVADAFVLVWIGRAQRADVGGHLPQNLLVVPGENEMGLFVDLHIDAIGKQKLDRMGVAQGEGGDFALDVGAVAGACDV